MSTYQKPPPKGNRPKSHRLMAVSKYYEEQRAKLAAGDPETCEKHRKQLCGQIDSAIADVARAEKRLAEAKARLRAWDERGA